MTVVTGESMGEEAPLLVRLLAAATSGEEFRATAHRVLGHLIKKYLDSKSINNIW